MKRKVRVQDFVVDRDAARGLTQGWRIRVLGMRWHPFSTETHPLRLSKIQCRSSETHRMQTCCVSDEYKTQISNINPRPAGGRGFEHPHCRFVEVAKKMAAARPGHSY